MMGIGLWSMGMLVLVLVWLVACWATTRKQPFELVYITYKKSMLMVLALGILSFVLLMGV